MGRRGNKEKLKRSASTEEGEAEKSSGTTVTIEKSSETPKSLASQVVAKKKPKIAHGSGDESDQEVEDEVTATDVRIPPPPSQQKDDEDTQPSNSQRSKSSERSSEAPASDKKQRKKRSEPVILTDAQEENMIEFLKNNPCYYNRKIKPYKFGPEKTNLWKDQADNLGLTTEQLSAWWKNQRSTYGRLTNPIKSGSAPKTFSDRENWVIRNFSFLKEHISRVKSRQARSVSIKF